MSEFDRQSHMKKIGAQPGTTRNATGNSKVRVKKSKLRALADKLRELEPKAIENISKSINSEAVDDGALQSSKWLVTSLVTVEKAASADELGQFNARLKGKRDDEVDQEETPEEIEKKSGSAVLSLVFNPNQQNP